MLSKKLKKPKQQQPQKGLLGDLPKTAKPYACQVFATSSCVNKCVCISLSIYIYCMCVCLFDPDLIGSMDQDHQTITSLKEGISKIELTNCHQEQLDMNFTVGGTFLSVLKHVQTLACFGGFFRHLFNIVI